VRADDLPFQFRRRRRSGFCWAAISADSERKSMTTGTVKFFNTTKGFGFIQPDDGGTDVFVHASAVEQAGMRSIVEGQKLTFDVVKDNRNGKSSAQNLRAA